MRVRNLILIFTFLFAACGTSTRVTSSWTKPNARPAGLRRIAVMALVKEERQGLRQQMESAIVGALSKRGYTAFSTFADYGPQRMARDDEQKAIASLKRSNSDAILTVVLLDKSKEENYTPGRINYIPVGGYYSRFWGYYSTLYDRTYVPGYYTVDTRYFWETNLYDLHQSGDDLIYSAQSESFDPSSAERLAQQYAKAIVGDMRGAGVIGK